jgi:hypothetical protein
MKAGSFPQWFPDTVDAAVALMLPLAAWVAYAIWARSRRQRRLGLAREICELASQHFLSSACTRCQETEMRLLDVSPQSRSIHYACEHCGKKSHAPACTDLAKRARDALDQLQAIAPDHLPLVFPTSAMLLPHETQTRTPIPEAVRAEVWRRDVGSCVACGTKQRLQFDHIIPVSQGGGSSVANLQVLCETCNRAKGAKV